MRVVRDRWLRVLIAGGGVAALETLLGLRALAGHQVTITLLAPDAEFLYRPVTVAEAFGHGEARRFALAEILADQHAERVEDSQREVDPEDHAVLTGSGARIEYDARLGRAVRCGPLSTARV
jgi:sulfide:quinone oxidoreductase